MFSKIFFHKFILSAAAVLLLARGAAYASGIFLSKLSAYGNGAINDGIKQMFDAPVSKKS